MANMAVVTYLSPKGRKMSRDVVDHSFAGILTYARKVAQRPGVRNVKLWSQGGKLLASPRAVR
jgi:hypothetical protein